MGLSCSLAFWKIDSNADVSSIFSAAEKKGGPLVCADEVRTAGLNLEIQRLNWPVYNCFDTLILPGKK
jgi:hypothetical protein